MTTERPRWGIAGVALGLAALARLETFLVIGLALGVLAAMRFGPAKWRRPVPAGAWRISIGLLALPVMCLHDVLLTGDPFFWTSVAASYSATAESAGRLPSLAAVARDLADLASGQAAVTLLAQELAAANDLLPAAISVAGELEVFIRSLERLVGRPVCQSGSGPTQWVMYPTLADARKSADRLRRAHKAYCDAAVEQWGQGNM